MHHGLHHGARPIRGCILEAPGERLASDAGRWALFVQPTNQCRWLEFADCYDTESGACEIGYRSPIGRRFLVKAVWKRTGWPASLA